MWGEPVLSERNSPFIPHKEHVYAELEEPALLLVLI
jgi:hypothetical protein